MKKKKSIWRLWAKSLGEKASKCDNESDKVAIIRTAIFATYLITNIAIVANAIRHWNDNTETQGVTQMILIDPQTKKEKSLQEIVDALYNKICEIEDYARDNKDSIDVLREEVIINRNECNSMSARIFEQEQENIGTTNSLYEMENKLDMLRLELENHVEGYNV